MVKRVTWLRKIVGAAAVVGVGGAASLMGCSGGSSSGAPGDEPTGEVSAETVPDVLRVFAKVYGTRDFVNAVDNVFADSNNQNRLGLGASSSVSGNSNRARKALAVHAEHLERFAENESANVLLSGKKQTQATEKSRLEPRVVVEGCPTIVNDLNEGVTTYTFAYDGCTPSGVNSPATGALTVQQVVFGQRGDVLTEANQRYFFGALRFGGKMYEGQTRHAIHPGGRLPDGTDLATETYSFFNMEIDSDSFNGEYELRYDGILPYVGGPNTGRAVVDIDVSPGAGAKPYAQWTMDLRFAATTSPGANQTTDVDSTLNGPAEVLMDTFLVKGSYQFELRDVVAKDACNAANSGSMTMKGANGQALVTFGPGCGEARYSINGGPEVVVNMTP